MNRLFLKLMSVVFAFFLCVACAGAQSVADWQRKALTDFPELGVKDSPFNRLYVGVYKVIQQKSPELLTKPASIYALAYLVDQTVTHNRVLVDAPPDVAAAGIIEYLPTFIPMIEKGAKGKP